ncbi:sugar porter family MFS transporter [Candidatus Latescibacterota bacterium]
MKSKEHDLMTDSNIISNEENTVYVYAIALVAALGGLLFGFDTGVISGAISFVTNEFSLNAHQEGFAVSNLLIGCIIGAVTAGFLSDKFGRKKMLIVSAVFFLTSALLSAFPRTFVQLVIARFIGGYGVGMASMLSPLYIAEISPARIRGRLVSLNQFTIVGGILLSYLANWLLVDIGPNNWRWMFASEALPAVLFLVALFAVPESPRWLVKSGRLDNALKILTKIGGKKHAEAEIDDIKSTIDKEKGSIFEIFKPGLRLVLLVGVLLAIFQQITGINTVIYYAPKIFMRAGYESASSALLAQVIVGFTNFVFTIIAIVTIDRFGRKPLLLIGLAGMGISFALAGFAFHSATIGATFILIPIILYVAFFAMSLGPVVWVLLSEIFPTKIRGRAMSIATMSLWVSCFLVSQSFPWLVEMFEQKTFYLYACICIIAFVFVFFMVTETKGKTLEEIEKMWEH